MLPLPKNAEAQAIQGITAYEEHCARCHSAPTRDTRAPGRELLRERTPEAVLEAITTGPMRVHAEGLTDVQKRLLAEQLTGHIVGSSLPGEASAMSNRCDEKTFQLARGSRWIGWGADLSNTRFQPAASAALKPADVPKLTLKWVFAYPNGVSAFAQPAVAGGRLFVGSDIGFVYGLDAASGCVYWSFRAAGPVRTAISVGELPAGRSAVYFGDMKANVYAVDAERGTLVWKQSADSHPLARITGAPSLAEGRLYVPVSSLEEMSAPTESYTCCTFRGSVVAYDAGTGTQLWKQHLITDPPRPTRKNTAGIQQWGPAGASVWSSPTIDLKREVLYVATGDAYTYPAADTSDAVVALDLRTGRIRWAAQATPRDAFIVSCEPTARFRDNCPDTLGPDFDFGSSPILRTTGRGRDLLVIGQKSGIAWAFDPDRRGAVVWQQRVARGSAGGGVQWGASADDLHAYFPAADAFAGLTAGGLTAVDLESGSVVWRTEPPARTCSEGRPCVQAQSAACTVIPGVVFSGTTSGVMRAYGADDGRILWEYDTVREYQTVNGVPGHGGAINGPGPVVVDGMLFMNSGYGQVGGGLSGNVLLAFAP
jgi:polyvinyl alcohol dehydrogenase (cytochrome)